jgi:hypothetical protein
MNSQQMLEPGASYLQLTVFVAVFGGEQEQVQWP